MNKQGLKSQLMRGAVGSVTVKVTFAILSFFISVVLARLLGASGFGTYSFSYAIIMLLALLAFLGFSELMVRETAKAQAKENWPLLVGLWHWGNQSATYFSLIILVIIFIVIYSFFDVTENIGVQTILVGSLVIPIIALVGVRSACIRGLGYTVLGQLPDSVIRTALFLVLIVLVPSYMNIVGSVEVMVMYLVSTIFAFIFSYITFIKLKPIEVEAVKSSCYNIRAWNKSILPLTLISSLQIINGYADIIILGTFRETEEVGIYKAVIQLSLLVSFGLHAINQVLLPHFSRLYVQDEYKKLQRLVVTSTRVILIISLPPAVLLIFFGSDILALTFGEPFFIGGIALTILAIGQLVNTAMGSVVALLNMTGHERYVVRGGALAAVVNIILNMILIPFYGMIGAAVATAVSLALWSILLRYYVRQKLNIEPSALFRI